jgi:hypothetical protein
VNLIGGDRRPPEQRQSYMRECAALGSSGGPVFSFHQSVIRGRTTERDAIPLVIRPHAGEGAASSDNALEVIDVRRFQIRPSGLIMAAIPIQSRNRVRLRTAVGGHRRLRLLSGNTIAHRRQTREWQCVQDVSSAAPCHFVFLSQSKRFRRFLHDSGLGRAPVWHLMVRD